MRTRTSIVPSKSLWRSGCDVSEGMSGGPFYLPAVIKDSQFDSPDGHTLLHEPDGTDILTDAEIRAVVARRSFIEGYVADLIKQYGEKNVLYFP